MFKNVIMFVLLFSKTSKLLLSILIKRNKTVWFWLRVCAKKKCGDYGM